MGAAHPGVSLGEPLVLGIVFGIFEGLLYLPEVPLNAAGRSLCATPTYQTLAASRATRRFLNFPLGFLESPSRFIFCAWLHKSAIELKLLQGIFIPIERVPTLSGKKDR